MAAFSCCNITLPRAILYIISLCILLSSGHELIKRRLHVTDNFITAAILHINIIMKPPKLIPQTHDDQQPAKPAAKSSADKLLLVGSSPATFRGSTIATRSALQVIRASRFRDCSRDAKACRVFYNATCCGGSCVNVRLDDNNCGVCGNKCAFMEACCFGQCKNLSMDPSNCGSCGYECPDSSCQFGLCGYY